MRRLLLSATFVLVLSLVVAYRPGKSVILLRGPQVSEAERLQALAKELERRDYLRRIEVRSGSGWGFLDFDDTTKAWLTYDRHRRHLQDRVMGGNCNGKWVNVSEQVILSVARAKADLSDLAKYGARNVCP